MVNWELITYFKPEEFQDPDVEGSGELINPFAVHALDMVRKDAGYPIIPHWSVGGCVDVNGTHGHAKKSYHTSVNGKKAFCAIDFHFGIGIPVTKQIYAVMKSIFSGIGMYYDWHWNGKLLPIGFHVDLRPVELLQIWTRVNGKYTYFLRR